MIKLGNDGPKNHSIFFRCYSIFSTPAAGAAAAVSRNGHFLKIIDPQLSSTVKPRFVMNVTILTLLLMTLAVIGTVHRSSGRVRLGRGQQG